MKIMGFRFPTDGPEISIDCPYRKDAKAKLEGSSFDDQDNEYEDYECTCEEKGNERRCIITLKCKI